MSSLPSWKMLRCWRSSPGTALLTFVERSPGCRDGRLRARGACGKPPRGRHRPRPPRGKTSWQERASCLHYSNSQSVAVGGTAVVCVVRICVQLQPELESRCAIGNQCSTQCSCSCAALTEYSAQKKKDLMLAWQQQMHCSSQTSPVRLRHGAAKCTQSRWINLIKQNLGVQRFGMALLFWVRNKI